MKTGDWGSEYAFSEASLSVARATLDLLDTEVDLIAIPDNIFAALLFKVLTKLLKPKARTWRPMPATTLANATGASKPTEEVKKNDPPPFVADRSVVVPLMDMGFHVAHIQEAQEKLRTNDLQALAFNLLENARPVTEDDEIKMAVWLSEETQSNDDKTDVKMADEALPAEPEKPPTPLLSPEEIAENTRLDAAEASATKILTTLRSKVRARSAVLGPRRQVLRMPWEAVAAAAPHATTQSRRGHPLSLAKAVDAIVFVSNDTDCAAVVSSSRASSTIPSFVTIAAGAQLVPVHTYVGNILHFASQDDPKRVVGSLTARWSDVEVTIPSSAFTTGSVADVPSTMLPIMEYYDRRQPPKGKVAKLGDATDCSVVFVNTGAERVVINSIQALWEKFVIEPGQVLVRTCSRGEEWFFHTVPSQKSVGFSFIPWNKPQDSETRKDPNRFVVLLPSPTTTGTHVYATAAAGLTNIFCASEGADDCSPQTLMASIGSNVVLVSHLLLDKKGGLDGFLSGREMESYLDTVWKAINAPLRGHTGSSAEVSKSSKSNTPDKSERGKKRMSQEAELQEEGDDTEKGKKKKKSSSTPQALVLSCDAPGRAHGLNVLSTLIRLADKNQIALVEPSLKRVSESLVAFNALEVDVAFSLLSLHPEFVRMRDVLDQMYRFSFFETGCACLINMLALPEDAVFKYRLLAHRTLRRLVEQVEKKKPKARPTTNAVSADRASSSESTEPGQAAVNDVPALPEKPTVKVPMDTFISKLDLSSKEHQAFSDAVTGFLLVESGNVVACPRPHMDQHLGQAKMEEFLELLESHLDKMFAWKVLSQTCVALPRTCFSLGTSPVGSLILQKLLGYIKIFPKNEDKFAYSNDWDIIARSVKDIVARVAAFVPQSREAIAKMVVEALQTTEDVEVASNFIVPLIASPLVLVACDAQGLGEVALNQLRRLAPTVDTPVGERAMSSIARLLKVLSQGKSRQVVAEGISEARVLEEEEILWLTRPRSTSAHLFDEPALVDEMMEHEGDEDGGNDFDEDATDLPELIQVTAGLGLGQGSLLAGPRGNTMPLGSNLAFPMARASLQTNDGVHVDDIASMRRGGIAVLADYHEARSMATRRYVLGTSNPDELLERLEIAATGSPAAVFRSMVSDTEAPIGANFAFMAGAPFGSMSDVNLMGSASRGGIGAVFPHSVPTRASATDLGDTRPRTSHRASAQDRGALRRLLESSASATVAAVSEVSPEGATQTPQMGSTSSDQPLRDPASGGGDVEMTTGEEEKTRE